MNRITIESPDHLVQIIWQLELSGQLECAGLCYKLTPLSVKVEYIGIWCPTKGMVQKLKH